MNLYSTKEFSDEEGPLAEEFKTAYIYGSRSELLELCEFFKRIEKELKKETNLHMQFQDYASEWNKEESIDLAIELVEQPIEEKL